MGTCVAAFLLSCLVGPRATAGVRDRARPRGPFDSANSRRKLLRSPVPSLSDVAIVLGFAVFPSLQFPVIAPGRHFADTALRGLLLVPMFAACVLLLRALGDLYEELAIEEAFAATAEASSRLCATVPVLPPAAVKPRGQSHRA
jgi:hypothetical protein